MPAIAPTQPADDLPLDTLVGGGGGTPPPPAGRFRPRRYTPPRDDGAVHDPQGARGHAVLPNAGRAGPEFHADERQVPNDRRASAAHASCS